MTAYKTIRLKQFSYDSPRAYFITVCTHLKQCTLSTVVNSEVELTEIGSIAKQEWERSFELRAELICDECEFMPNHIHAIVEILETKVDKDAHCRAALQDPLYTGSIRNSRMRDPQSVSSFVSGFKSAATREVRKISSNSSEQLWQPRIF